ncbi:U-megalopygitoxin(8)-Mc8-like [Aphomia sociella]
MASKYLTAILLILPVVYAQIHIELVASRAVHLVGDIADIISDTERQSFRLRDSNLKNAVKTFFGARPDDVYVRSPTPWGDLYTTYGWSQVKRILEPVRARILKIRSESSRLMSQYLENNSSSTTALLVDMKEFIINRISSTWQKDDNLTVSQEIGYSVEFEDSSGLDKTFSFTSKWGESYITEESVSLGPNSGVKVKLEPGQKVIVEVYAIKDSMQVHVEYEARLTGSTAINYGSKYKGHHFWALDINDVIRAAGLRTSIPSSEIIDLVYYTKLHVDVKNSEDNTLMYTISL